MCRETKAANEGYRNSKNSPETLFNVFTWSQLCFTLKCHDRLQYLDMFMKTSASKLHQHFAFLLYLMLYIKYMII